MLESTKDRILDVSLDLFSKYGYAETSIRDIAKQVGIKTSSIYYHFESKEAILDYILDEYIATVYSSEHRRDWYAAKDSVISGSLRPTPKEILAFLFFEFDEQSKEKYRKMVKIICSEAVRNDAVRRYFYNSIERSVKYIATALNDLQCAEKMARHDSERLACVLHAIAFAFMHLDSIDMQYMSPNRGKTDMFSLLAYVLEAIMEEPS